MNFLFKIQIWLEVWIENPCKCWMSSTSSEKPIIYLGLLTYQEQLHIVFQGKASCLPPTRWLLSKAEMKSPGEDVAHWNSCALFGEEEVKWHHCYENYYALTQRLKIKSIVWFHDSASGRRPRGTKAGQSQRAIREPLFQAAIFTADSGSNPGVPGKGMR